MESEEQIHYFTMPYDEILTALSDVDSGLSQDSNIPQRLMEKYN